MAVQKSRVTRKKRGDRRAHNRLANPTLAIDVATGETHRRHHVSPDGYYKGRQIIDNTVKVEEEDDDNEQSE